ncbi:hypothetical protein KFL_001260010 [Klebsormidium nitens]|uniref:GTPase Der n=1 Tax=Klebsormidium nitens TaxID=105231 RepID=A0A1Y1I103_KLENI|nr:hypothetical protein KFL_001260010 [Klebsormidium nitens]|eukprot:GAQ82831.1 hypothetical protein KFL_001260010 [Klebsormidium nitens]
MEALSTAQHLGGLCLDPQHLLRGSTRGKHCQQSGPARALLNGEAHVGRALLKQSASSLSPLFDSLRCEGSPVVRRGIAVCQAVQTVDSNVNPSKASHFERLDDEGANEPLTPEEYEKAAKKVLEDYARELELVNRLADEREAAGEDDEEGDYDGEGEKKKKKKRMKRREAGWEVPDSQLPTVAIVGRPNVGKSALFNRIAGGDIAIVHDEPGVTRDRLYSRGFWGRNEFMLVDTGGVMTVPKSESIGSDATTIHFGGGLEGLKRAAEEAARAGLPGMIERQAANAVEGAHAIIFVVDGQEGLTAADTEIAQWLRREHSDKPITLAVNKCESPVRGQLQAAEFWPLGYEPVPVSAITATGTGELMDRVCVKLPMRIDNPLEENEERPLGIAIVGRPNVGKSSILNALVGEERTIVSPISGTTRDAIDQSFKGEDGQAYRLIDTAGIRRRTRVQATGSRAEALSVNRAFKAIKRADVVCLVIEAMSGVVEQDYKLAERVAAEGKACVVVVNKWDTVPNKETNTMKTWEEAIRDRLRGLSWAPMIFISAATGQRVPKLLEVAAKAGEQHGRRLSTATLNAVVQEAVQFKQPAAGKAGRRGKIYYCTQAAVRPPTFIFFVNSADLFNDSYRRYIERQLRSNVGYPGTPLRLVWRSKPKDKAERSSQQAKAAQNSRGGQRQ